MNHIPVAYRALLTWIGVLILLLYDAATFAQTKVTNTYAPGSKLRQEQLQNDFIVLRKSLEEAHASLYRYKSKEAMNTVWEHAFAAVNRDMTEREFYQILTSVLSNIEDGHSYSFLSKDFAAFLSQTAKVFPLKLRFLGRKAYVVSSPVPEVAPGWEVLSINGRPMQEVTADLCQHLISDGDVQSGKIWKLNERFGYFYYLFIGQPEQFDIEYCIPANHTRRNIRIAGLTQAQIKQLLPESESADISKRKPLRLELLKEPRTALLTIETFSEDDIKQAGQDFPRFLKSVFQQVHDQQIQDLILDLRGNDGGDDYGPLLFSYLAQKDFHYVDHIETCTNRFSVIQNYTHLDAAFLEKFVESLMLDGNGRYRVKSESDISLSLQKSQASHYNNRVWFLTNGETFSSAAMFCDLARSEKRGPFVGEETGGAYYGNSAGEFVLITLPETKIKIMVPLEQYVMAVTPSRFPRRGVIPDYPVLPTVQNLLTGVDTELNYTLELIRKKRKSGTSKNVVMTR